MKGLKTEVANTLGSGVEDCLEATQQEMFRAEGRQQAALALHQKITALSMALNPESESYADCKKQLALALTHCSTLSEASKVSKNILEGKAMAFAQTMRSIQKYIASIEKVAPPLQPWREQQEQERGQQSPIPERDPAPVRSEPVAVAEPAQVEAGL